MTKVFVYGTLMKGHHNHRLLQDINATFVGEGRTLESYVMLYAGIPYVTKDAKKGRHALTKYPVKGEVYEVDDVGLARLDQLEGYKAERLDPAYNHYNREEIDVLVHWPDTPEQTKASIYFGGSSRCRYYVDNPVLPNTDGLLAYPGIRWEDDEEEETDNEEEHENAEEEDDT